jgi:hypothetical protein
MTKAIKQGRFLRARKRAANGALASGGLDTMSPRRIVGWEEPTKDEGATMNVVKLKPKK